MNITNHANRILGLMQAFFAVRQFVGILMILSLIIVVLIWGRNGLAIYYLIAETILSLLAGLFFLAGIPFLFFKSLRRYSGLLFLIAVTCFAAATWWWSLILALSFAGVIWTIIGCFFAGIGVVPVAAVALLLNGEYLTFGFLIGLWLLIYVFQFISAYFLGSIEALKLETEVYAFVERDGRLMDHLVDLKSGNLPLIKNAQLLPAPKEEIAEVLAIREREINEYSSRVIYEDAEYLLPLLDEEFDKVNGMDWFVEKFYSIDASDAEDVRYINANFSDSGDLIEHDRLFDVWMKYS